MTYAIRNSHDGQALVKGLPTVEDAEKLRDAFVNPPAAQLYVSPETAVDTDPFISIRLPRSTWADLLEEIAYHPNLRTVREMIAESIR